MDPVLIPRSALRCDFFNASPQLVLTINKQSHENDNGILKRGVSSYVSRFRKEDL